MDKISRNNRRQLADQILTNPLFQESFQAVEMDIVERIRKAEVTNPLELQQLTTELQLLSRIKSAITSQIELGKIADFNEHLSNKVS